ncbi:hypothetical protein ADIMK_0652 [Marinobacterium lacunae]|uniref:Uncharacterized protein n=1 Tax=Marinobacterium lacunae TaxID=1232683 RepID=A0A081G2E5_9GAMM|nr:hypothetical protein ADIMK_0652 [Marinobacterium lacunae]
MKNLCLGHHQGLQQWVPVLLRVRIIQECQGAAHHTMQSKPIGMWRAVLYLPDAGI